MTASKGYAVGVAGFLAIEFAQRGWPAQWPPQIRAISFDGPVVDGPAGKFWYAYPRAAMDARGTLHVIWAEPDEPLPPVDDILRGSAPILRSVWYASLNAGKWSQAERIYRSDRIEWNERDASHLIVDTDDGLHVAFVAEIASRPSVVYLSRGRPSAARWSAMSWPRLGVAYLDLAVGRDGRAAVVTVEGIPSPRPRPNVLYLKRAGGAAGAWTPARQVSTPAEDPAIEPHLFFDRSGALHLVWVHQAEGKFTGGEILHATLTTAAGRHSTSALRLPPDTITSGLQAAMDACGTIHVLTQAYTRGSPELRYARFSSGVWSGWSRPFATPGAHASVVSTENAVDVVWSATFRASSDSGPVSVLEQASLAVTRRRRRDRS